MKSKKLPPIHPGEVLSEEFLVPLDIRQSQLARDTGVPSHRISEIVRGERGISPNTALRLARYFGTSDQFWLNLQSRYELEIERDRFGQQLTKEVRVLVRG